MISLILCISNLYSQPFAEIIDELIRNRIEAAGFPPNIVVGKEIIFASNLLPRFYENRGYEPAWTNQTGPLPLADSLLLALKSAEQEGLHSEVYHLAKIEDILSNIKIVQKNVYTVPPRLIADLELLLTDAYLIYGAHLLAGRINPETLTSEWIAMRREANLTDLLQTALQQNRIIHSLRSLLPPQEGYWRLREALARYRKLQAAGGWQMIPEGPVLRPGDKEKRIPVLRERLIMTGDLLKGISADSTLDSTLADAIKRFQKRNGLDTDGIVGKETLKSINVPVEYRIQELIVNMERWRWLPQEFGEHHIMINIANFELDVFEKSRPVLTMRIIVGRSYRKTPVFSDRVTYLVLNPSWNVPSTIATQDILPQVKKDIAYLSQQNMKVFKGWGADAIEINPASVNWSEVSAATLPFRFRQDPGPANALGRIKFMFPNKFDVYLHDTPARGLFSKVKRDFSSGCIRIEKPLELAVYLMKDIPGWDRKTIQQAIDSGKEQTVRLKSAMPVHLLYWTAWVSEDGLVNFREDIYSRDTALWNALQEMNPSVK